MRLSGTRTGDLLDAVAARCERLVSGSVKHVAERHRQRRLIGLMLAAPLLVAAPAAILFPPLIGMPATLWAGAAILGVPLLLAAMVAVSGRTGFASAGALLYGVVTLATIVAAAGGASSPAALVLGALVFEAWWTGRTRLAAFGGAVASLVALALQALMGAELMHGAAVPAAADWLIPLAYLGFVLPRLATWVEDSAEATTSRETRLEDIVEAVVLRMDLAGEVADASAQARRILGLAPQLLLSSGLFDRLHVADRVAYLCALGDLREDQGFRSVHARIRVPGSAGSAATDFRPFVIEMMRPTADEKSITMLVRAADAVEPRALGDAAESRELASSRILAAVSHELRTPLNSIIGFSDMMLHGMAGVFADPRQKEYVGLVRDSGSHLLSVVNSILDVSKIESGTFTTNPETFRFAEAVEASRAMLMRQAAEKNVDLTVDVAPEVGEIHADNRAVRQMIINLVSNAIKFTPEGGAVRIGAHRIGSRLHFWVSDTGIGIPAQDLTRIGQPFVQVENDYTRRFNGAGLGLSLVKGLVALHQGTMSIESEPGRGTTVTISLPVERPARGSNSSAAILEMTGTRSKEAHDGTFRKIA
ncbi:MAG: ATP-binding protein [Hyphomicrobiales bacterium]|nr:ATP-binding protein [Hyphomicrobiales bacterium]